MTCERLPTVEPAAPPGPIDLEPSEPPVRGHIPWAYGDNRVTALALDLAGHTRGVDDGAAGRGPVPGLCAPIPRPFRRTTVRCARGARRRPGADHALARRRGLDPHGVDRDGHGWPNRTLGALGGALAPRAVAGRRPGCLRAGRDRIRGRATRDPYRAWRARSPRPLARGDLRSRPRRWAPGRRPVGDPVFLGDRERRVPERDRSDGRAHPPGPTD